MIDAFNREVQGLDDVELWIHTCWGNPNMQRVMEDTGYANSIEIYLERCRGDVWTLEMKDRNQQDLELFAPFRNDLKKKVCIGAVSHRALQADRPEDVAGEIRKALKYIPAASLIVSSDCRCGQLWLIMAAHGVDEIFGEAPLRNQSGADLAMIAPQ